MFFFTKLFSLGKTTIFASFCIFFQFFHLCSFVKCLDDKIKSRNTFDLLNYLKKKNKKIKLFFLIGADNLIKFHKWNKWRKIPEFAKIVVFARPNYSIKALNSVASKKLKKKDWMYINSKKMNISSSLIRKF